MIQIRTKSPSQISLGESYGIGWLTATDSPDRISKRNGTIVSVGSDFDPQLFLSVKIATKTRDSAVER